MTLDDDVQIRLAALTQSGLPRPGQAPLAEVRMAEKLARSMETGPTMTRFAEISLGEDQLYGRLYIPSANPSALIVFFHGGGWTLGSAAGSDAAVRRFAAGSNCAVLSVDYRLAPEFPFPAAVSDAYNAAAWAASRTTDLIGHHVPLVVAGESAGANLAAVASLQARDRGGPAIAAQLLFCPCVSYKLDTSFMKSFVPPFAPLPAIEWFFDQYVPCPQDRSDPRFSPIDAASLENLPPAYIATAQWDILRAQGEAYAMRLESAGVPTRSRCYAGTFHGFVELDGGLHHSRRLAADVSDFLGSHLATTMAPGSREGK